MNSRLLVTAGVLAAVLASPLAAQGGGGMAGMNMDPTNKIVGSGKLPNGWMNRFDEPTATLPAIDMRQMGTSLHFRSGPAAIYWNTKDVATGYYTVSATFNQKKSMNHEGYGIFVGGSNLPDPTQDYLYFLIKPVDGTFLINHRAGNATPKAIVALTPEAAINKDAAGTGAATNAIAIRVAKDSVHFYINGKEVRTFAKTALDGAATQGLVGLRVNHNLDITVEGFGIKK
jgi:hypothetical protein